MSKTFRAWDVDQVWLLPPSIHYFVPARHPAHLGRELVRRELDLSAIFAPCEREERGRPPYHLALMVAEDAELGPEMRGDELPDRVADQQARLERIRRPRLPWRPKPGLTRRRPPPSRARRPAWSIMANRRGPQAADRRTGRSATSPTPTAGCSRPGTASFKATTASSRSTPRIRSSPPSATPRRHHGRARPPATRARSGPRTDLGGRSGPASGRRRLLPRGQPRRARGARHTGLPGARPGEPRRRRSERPAADQAPLADGRNGGQAEARRPALAQIKHARGFRSKLKK